MAGEWSGSKEREMEVKGRGEGREREDGDWCVFICVCVCVCVRELGGWGRMRERGWEREVVMGGGGEREVNVNVHVDHRYTVVSSGCSERVLLYPSVIQDILFFFAVITIVCESKSICLCLQSCVCGMCAFYVPIDHRFG